MAREGGKDRGLFQRKGSSTWWIRWTCNYGHEHREKGGSKSVARQLYEQRKTAVRISNFCLTEERQRQAHLAQTRFSDVMVRYLAWAAESRTRSLNYRTTASKHLLRAFGGKSLHEITRTDVERYIRDRGKAGAKPATINRERSVLGHLYKRAIDWGLTISNPVAGIEHLKEDNVMPRALTAEEEQQLFDALPKHFHPFTALALHTGMRLGELRAQLWSDIDLASGVLRVTRPKSGKTETIPLNATAFSILAGLPQNSDRVFPAIPTATSDSFKRYALRAGLDDVTFHTTRDTHISRLAPHVSVPVLMQLARHRNYSTTMRYLDFHDEALRSAVEKLVEIQPETGTLSGTDIRQPL